MTLYIRMSMCVCCMCVVCVMYDIVHIRTYVACVLYVLCMILYIRMCMCVCCMCVVCVIVHMYVYVCILHVCCMCYV